MLPSKRVRAAAPELYAIELGEGPPLLFLHGVTASSCVWQPVRLGCGVPRRTGVAPRLPGIVVNGAGHYVPEEKPAETARIITEFAAGSLTAAAGGQRGGSTG